MVEKSTWRDEFDALPDRVQSRVRVAAECFGVPLITAYYRAKVLGLLSDDGSGPTETGDNHG